MKPPKPSEGKTIINDRADRQYRIYWIVSGRTEKTWKAVAYLGSGCIGPIEVAEAASMNEVIFEMKAALDVRVSEMRLAKY